MAFSNWERQERYWAKRLGVLENVEKVAALSGYNRLRRFQADQRRIRAKVKDGVEKKIRTIAVRDRILFNSMFVLPVLVEFSKVIRKSKDNIMIIMIMDLYHTFTIKDAKLWSVWVNNVTFRRRMLTLIEDGYVTGQRSGRFNSYFLSLKGKLVVKEFNKYYNGYIKKLFDALAEENRRELKTVVRIRPSRINKSRNRVAGKKPEAGDRGEDTGNSD